MICWYSRSFNVNHFRQNYTKHLSLPYYGIICWERNLPSYYIDFGNTGNLIINYSILLMIHILEIDMQAC